MPRRTLIDFFNDLEKTKGEFLTYDDGYRCVVVHVSRGRRGRAGGRSAAAGRRYRQWTTRRTVEREPAGVGLDAVGLSAGRRRPRTRSTTAPLQTSCSTSRKSSARRPSSSATRSVSSERDTCLVDTGHRQRQIRGSSDLPRRHAGHGRGSHLHVRRDLRTEGCGADPPQHPGEHHPDRT